MALLTGPGVQYDDATVVEIARVTSRDRRAAGAGNGSDLSIELGDGTSTLLACGGDFRKHGGCVSIERQDSAREVFLEHRCHRRLQRGTPLALWQKLKSIHSR